MKLKLITIFFLGYCACHGVTLEKFIENNIKNVNDMKNSLDSYSNNKSEHKSIIYDFLPDAKYSANRSQDLFSGDDYYSASLSVSKSISINEPTIFNYLRSKNNMLNSELEKEEIKRKVIYNIAQYFLDVVKAKKRLEIYNKNYELQKNIRNQTKIQFENDQKSLLDNQQSEIDLLSAEIALKEAVNSYNNARQNLFLYIQCEDDNQVLEFDEKILPSIIKEDYNSYSYDILKQENNLKNSKLFLNQEKINFLPYVNLSWNYSSNAKGDYIYDSLNQKIGRQPLEFSDLASIDNYEDGASYSISLNYNLLNLLTHSEYYSRYKRNYKISMRNYKYSKEQFLNEVNQLFQKYETGETTLEITRKKMILAEKNLDIAQIKYESGTIGLIDYDSSRVKLLNSKLEYINLYFEQFMLYEKINLKFRKKMFGRW